MTAHIGQPTPSRRFIKIYLGTWGLLALVATGYLAVLTFPPQAGSLPQSAIEPPKKDVGESKAIVEMRGSLSEIRKDVTELQTAVGERVATEKVVETRLTALEGRVTTVDGSQSSPTAAGAGDGADNVARKAGDLPAVGAPGKAPGETTAPPVAKPPFVPIETGSIASKDTGGVASKGTGSIDTGSIASKDKEEAKEEIVFGEPVVRREGQEFAVQLAAASSVGALRQSWDQLSERHAGALGRLQPRVVSPRSEGGIYRLLAGPLPTKADAERICSELRAGPKGCFATRYSGAPL
jgi:cell division septation protein DedD